MCCLYSETETRNEAFYEEPLYLKLDNKEVAIHSYEITDPNQDVLDYRGKPKRNIEFDLDLEQMKDFSLYYELEEIYKDLSYYQNLTSKNDKENHHYKMAKLYGFSKINKAKRFNKEPLYFNSINKSFSIGRHNCKLIDIRFQQRVSLTRDNIFSYWSIYGQIIIKD